MDPNQNVTGVLVKRGYLDTDINTEKMPCEDEARDQVMHLQAVCVCVCVCIHLLVMSDSWQPHGL